MSQKTTRRIGRKNMETLAITRMIVITKKLMKDGVIRIEFETGFGMVIIQTSVIWGGIQLEMLILEVLMLIHLMSPCPLVSGLKLKLLILLKTFFQEKLERCFDS